MTDYLTIKYQELAYAKKHHKHMLVKVLTKLIEKEIKPGKQLKIEI